MPNPLARFKIRLLARLEDDDAEGWRGGFERLGTTVSGVVLGLDAAYQ